MTATETPASSNDDETPQAETNVEASTDAVTGDSAAPASATTTTQAATDTDVPESSAVPNDTTAATQALEWHAPVLVRVDEHTTIPRLLKERVQRGATRPLILRKVGMGDTWRPVTAREFYDEVQSVAAGLIARGLKPGGRVAIMSRTRYEWTRMKKRSLKKAYLRNS